MDTADKSPVTIGSKAPPLTVRVAAAALRLAAGSLYGDDCMARLQALAGLPCPHCGAVVVLDGARLVCSEGLRYGAKCCESWRNPDAAEADILGNSPQ
jgi:hypothetical protein